jgi:hypothetical protein
MKKMLEKLTEKISFLLFLLVCPVWLHVFFLFFYNETELGAEIDPVMVLTPVPSSIGLDGDQTHDLPTVSRVLYPLTTAFATSLFSTLKIR